MALRFRQFLSRIFHGFLDLFKGADFDLTNAFPRDIEFTRKLFQGDRVIFKPTCHEDAFFTVGQNVQGIFQHFPPCIKLILFYEDVFGPEEDDLVSRFTPTMLATRAVKPVGP